MSKSTRLRIRDIRSVYRLLGECCELGADPIAWRRHLARRVAGVVGGDLGLYHEVQVVARPFVDLFWLRPLFFIEFGWPTPGDRKPYEEHMQSGRPEDGPHITPDLLWRRLKIMQWSQNPDRATWHRSRFFNEFVKHTHFDDGLVAHHLMEPGRIRWLSANRAIGDRPYNRRERRLMALLNLELSLLGGGKLARLEGPTVTDLSPRQREVLICLMNGDSEAQVALKLEISRHTVHDYVKMLHGRFGVHSRGELLARCRAFWPVLFQESQTKTSGE